MGLNVCSQEQEEKCKVEFGKYYEWTCEECGKKRLPDVHPYALHLIDLRRVLKAGYPFGKNDLGYQEWLDLGLVNEMMER